MTPEEKPSVTKQRAFSGRPTSFRDWRAAAQKIHKTIKRRHQLRCLLLLVQSNEVKKIYPYCFRNKKKITIVDSYFNYLLFVLIHLFVLFLRAPVMRPFYNCVKVETPQA